MLKYLFFIIFGIILFLIQNNLEKFNIGGQSGWRIPVEDLEDLENSFAGPDYWEEMPLGTADVGMIGDAAAAEACRARARGDVLPFNRIYVVDGQYYFYTDIMPPGPGTDNLDAFIEAMRAEQQRLTSALRNQLERCARVQRTNLVNILMGRLGIVATNFNPGIDAYLRRLLQQTGWNLEEAIKKFKIDKFKEDTGITDDAQAEALLDADNWDLHEAIHRYKKNQILDRWRTALEGLGMTPDQVRLNLELLEQLLLGIPSPLGLGGGGYPGIMERQGWHNPNSVDRIFNYLNTLISILNTMRGNYPPRHAAMDRSDIDRLKHAIKSLDIDALRFLYTFLNLRSLDVSAGRWTPRNRPSPYQQHLYHLFKDLLVQLELLTAEAGVPDWIQIIRTIQETFLGSCARAQHRKQK